MAEQRTTGQQARDVLAAEEFGVPAPDPALHHDDAHDVLAAEEFGVPAPDPALHHDDAHDVLAAEEFGVPAPDPALNHGPIRLPDDPTGIAEAHDVLAAEEFALPAPRHLVATPGAAPSGSLRTRAALVVGGGVVFAVLLRKRRA